MSFNEVLAELPHLSFERQILIRLLELNDPELSTADEANNCEHRPIRVLSDWMS